MNKCIFSLSLSRVCLGFFLRFVFFIKIKSVQFSQILVKLKKMTHS